MCVFLCRKRKAAETNVTVHGSVLRHSALKGISAQIVSAAVSASTSGFSHSGLHCRSERCCHAVKEHLSHTAPHFNAVQTFIPRHDLSQS